MIQLGDFILLCVSIILYIIWSYHSIKNIIKYQKYENNVTFGAFIYIGIHVVSIMLLLIHLLVNFIFPYIIECFNYLNQYTIP